MLRKLILSLLMLIIAFVPAFAMGGSETGSDSAETTDYEVDLSLEGELVYWSNWNETEPQGMVISQAIDEFTKIHPNVKIDVVWNGRENRKVLLPALESGRQVDLFEQTTDLVLVNLKDYLLDLTPYFDKAYDTTDGVPYIDTLLPAAVDLIRSFDSEGKLYAVPYQPNLMVVFYNKDHFEAAGIEKVPETWDEFLDACGKLKAAGYVPMTCDDAYLINLLGVHFERIKGQDWLRENISNPEVVFTDPEVIEGIRDFKEMMDNGYFSEYILSNKYPAGQQEMAMGGISMYYNGSWLPNEVKATAGPDYRWGSFNWPIINAEASDAGHVQYNSQALAINKNCKYPEAAFEFAVFLTTGAWDNKLAEETMGVPVGKNGTWPEQLKDAEAIYNAIDYRITSDYGIFSIPDYNPLIISAISNVMNGSITPEAAAEELSKM